MEPWAIKNGSTIGVTIGVASLLLMFATTVHFRDLYEKRPDTELNT
jgi:hypothetical protein